MKRIPSRVTIGSYEIQVRQLDADAFVRQVGRNDCYGMFDPNTLTIWLCKPPPRNKGAKQLAFQTYWHELMHACFFASVRPRLYTDEKLVDQMGGFLAQVMLTAKYD